MDCFGHRRAPFSVGSLGESPEQFQMNLNGEPTGVAASLAAGCEQAEGQERNVLAALAALDCRRHAKREHPAF